MAKIIDGKKISQEIKDELKERVAALKEKGVEVTLAVIQVGNNRKSNLNTLFLKSSHSLLEFILNLL